MIDELMKCKKEALVYHGIVSYSQRCMSVGEPDYILTATCLDRIGVSDINKHIETAATCLVILVGGTALAPHPIKRGSSPSHS